MTEWAGYEEKWEPCASPIILRDGWFGAWQQEVGKQLFRVRAMKRYFGRTMYQDVTFTVEFLAHAPNVEILVTQMLNADAESLVRETLEAEVPGGADG